MIIKNYPSILQILGFYFSKANKNNEEIEVYYKWFSTKFIWRKKYKFDQWINSYKKKFIILLESSLTCLIQFQFQKEIKQVNDSQVSNFIQDIEKINKVQHPNIVRILGIAKNDQKTPFAILTERCDINLYQAISTKKFNKIDLSLVIYEIAKGMKFIHSIQIINTNLNPSKILIGKDGKI